MAKILKLHRPPITQSAAKIAGAFTDLVTALENSRPAVMSLAERGKDDTCHRLAVGEIHNLAYVLSELARAFDLNIAVRGHREDPERFNTR